MCLIAFAIAVLASGCETKCEGLSQEACESEDDCSLIGGRPVAQGEQCLEESQFAGCERGGGGCGDAFTEALDPDGRPWLFSSTCVPEGWTTDNAPPDLMDLPSCSGGSSDSAAAGAQQPADAGAQVDARVDPLIEDMSTERPSGGPADRCQSDDDCNATEGLVCRLVGCTGPTAMLCVPRDVEPSCPPGSPGSTGSERPDAG